jgi:hypothetical protein
MSLLLIIGDIIILSSSVRGGGGGGEILDYLLLAPSFQFFFFLLLIITLKLNPIINQYQFPPFPQSIQETDRVLVFPPGTLRKRRGRRWFRGRWWRIGRLKLKSR